MAETRPRGSKLPSARFKAVAAIDGMASLEVGWLNGFGSPVSEEVRNSAKKFLGLFPGHLEFYAVAPTEEGGILLELEAKGWDYGIEFHADGSFAIFGIELTGFGEFCEEFLASGYMRFVKRSKEVIN